MSGRVVLVTGGSRGIGLACARRFQAAGDEVAVTYRTAAPDLEGDGKPLKALRCDVSSPEQVEAAFAELEADLGPAEVVVCAAGITADGLLLRMSEERWSEVLDINLGGSFRVTKRALGPMLKARGGRIVLVSSVVAFLGNAGQTNYAASKAGLVGFGRSLAREVASRSITVNVVAPGLVDTDMLSALSEEQLKALAGQVPLGRLGAAEEVAGAVEYLASPAAAYVTGAVLHVDGGLGMGN
ncbi:MAG: fabG [Acidimicrobiaceae bacterium]|nr:fabG [Acidimicrobiaceae bacterium]